MPIWQCEQTGYREAIASYDELLAKPGVAGLDVWEEAKAKNPDNLAERIVYHRRRQKLTGGNGDP